MTVALAGFLYVASGAIQIPTRPGPGGLQVQKWHRLKAVSVIEKTATLQLIGAWNLAIFHPDWVSKNLFPEADLKYGLAMGAYGGTIATYQVPQLTLQAAAGRVALTASSTKKDELSYLEATAKGLLLLLPETPFGAVILSYYFDAPPYSDLRRLHSFSDDDLLKDAGVSVTGTSLVREMKHMGEVFNFSVNAEPTSKVRMTFAFERETESALEAAKLLDGLVATARDACLSLLAVYGIKSL